MARRLFGLVAAVASAVFAIACNEAPPSAPQDGPSFAKAVDLKFACLFTGNPSLSNSAGSYFQTNDDRKAASGWITLMQDGYAVSGPAGARDAGYSLLALTGAASRNASRAGSLDIGETMVKQAVNCMYDTNDETDFADWPDDNQYDFSKALDAPHGGAFFVRGGSSDHATLPAVGNIASLNTPDPAGGNVSAIAPPSSSSSTWPSILANKRTLIYGEPVPDGFDWKLIGRNTPFSPHAVVALCQAVHPGVEFFQDADVVHQESVGTIGFKESEALCGTLPSDFAAGIGGFRLVDRLYALADRLLSPEPLHAAAVVATKTIGGSASGAKADEFTVQNLPEVNLEFTNQPPVKIKVVSQRFGVTVNVATPDGEPAGGIKVNLTVVNNNGTGTNIYEVTPAGKAAGYSGCNPADSVPDPANPASQVPAVAAPEETTLGTVSSDGTSQSTDAIWVSNLCITSTGAAMIVATSVADGNSFAGIGTATSNKLNVKP